MANVSKQSVSRAKVHTKQNIHKIVVGHVAFANNKPFSLISGPCQLESRDHAMMMADKLKNICARLGIGLVYKTSFDKANRTSLYGERGLGLEKSLAIFDELRAQFDMPVLTDIHTAQQCAEVSHHVDILQIPAFLCRQTDVLIAAAQSGAVVNVKKGQFLAPWDMDQVVEKITQSGNDKILLTERGSSFGYNTLVTDMRSLERMAQTGFPVIMDATHAVQQPGGQGSSSGGQREYVSTISRAAIAVGVAGLFLETHQDPDHAPCDGPNMIAIDQLEPLLAQLKRLDDVTKADQNNHVGQ